MALKHDCGTCRHDETGWLCDKCDGNNMWERHPDYKETNEEPEEEKYCCDCKHVHTSDLDIPCAICNGHSRFEPKEEKKMHDVKVMEAKEVMDTPRVSYLGQTALNTLADIYTKLGMIEDFIDAPTESYPSLGNLGCPDNLIHNLKQINEIANVINQRLDRLQEKL